MIKRKTTTNFDKIKSMTKLELARWLAKVGPQDDSVWLNWFDDNYCKKCAPVIREEDGRTVRYAYCELSGMCCRLGKEAPPADCDLVMLWLDEECKEQ
mgnify:FL=1